MDIIEIVKEYTDTVLMPIIVNNGVLTEIAILKLLLELEKLDLSKEQRIVAYETFIKQLEQEKDKEIK